MTEADRPDRAAEAEAGERRRRVLAAVRRAGRAAQVRARLPWALVAMLAVAAVVAGIIAWSVAARWIPEPSTSVTSGSVQALYAIGEKTSASQPVGVAISGDRLYVADARRGLVEVFDRNGSRLPSIGAGYLKAPVHVAVGPIDGRIYVCDRGRDAVVVYSADGERLRILGSGGVDPTSTPVAWRPLTLGFADDGALYVADASERQQIVSFSPTGRRMTVFGSGLPIGRTGSPLSFPNGLAVTGDSLLVADSNNGRVLVLGRDGGFVREIRTDGLPRGIAATGGGGFIVTDAALNSVTAYSSAGRPIAVAGLTGSTAGLFSAPSGVAIGEDGRVYVGNTGAGRVQVIRMSGARPATASASGRAWPWVLIAASLAALAIGAAFVASRLSRGVADSDATRRYNRHAG
jgi:DNA-binding beta-propeller fold protein YncE